MISTINLYLFINNIYSSHIAGPFFFNSLFSFPLSLHRVILLADGVAVGVNRDDGEGGIGVGVEAAENST